MKQAIFPKKLLPGDTIAVIAPSRSFSILAQDCIDIADGRLHDLGFTIKFGQYIAESDDFLSSSIESRIADLHAAFADPAIKGILTVLGGFNSNQLLQYIDYDVVKNNPKILCGYSDITALQNAIFTQTGLVTYSGPHYSSFGQLLNFQFTLDYFKKCCMQQASYEIKSSGAWSDNLWYMDQENCNLIKNEGMYAIFYGQATGTLIGGNLVTLQVLQGTPYFPSLQNAILFLEDDYESQPYYIDRNLQSIIQRPDFHGVLGIVFGRFQKATGMTRELLQKIIATKKELQGMPIIADVDFGHTSPMITFPIGGTVSIKAFQHEVSIIIEKH